MESYIREQLDKYCKANGWTSTDQDIIEVLAETDHIYEEKIKSHRWWDEVIRVVEIDGMFIGFEYAVSTGDASATELGYVFDIDRMWEMRPVTKTVVSYERVPPTPEEIADAWNAEHPVGTKVVRTDDSGNKHHTKTQSRAVVRNVETALIRVEDDMGCYDLSRVEAV